MREQLNTELKQKGKGKRTRANNFTYYESHNKLGMYVLL